ncbi:MAG TPA: hypothetical protein VNF07_01550 [Acidimicrobiales bacterium]|nr:hypothetical protein [Acidimicrobiales bacterium]
MSRVLVVGTVPPPGGAAARRLAVVAAGRLADGDEVTVLSPDPRSAAHRSGSLTGFALVAQLAWRSRRHDVLELRIEPSLPLAPDSGRALRTAVLLALGVVLGRYASVTLRLDSPVPIPGGVGGRATTTLWAAVDTVVVQREEDRALLAQVPGLSAEQIVLEPPAEEAVAAAVRRWPTATDSGLRSEAQDEIRRSAAEERSLLAARREIGTPLPRAGSAFSEHVRVRASLPGLAHAALGLSRRGAAGIVRRQRALRTGSRSR